MRALTGVRWGRSRETLPTTYKALIKPLITYATPVWYPNASRSAIQSLQAIQNAALRIASGTKRMTSQDHLHSEAVDRELSMLCSQFLLEALRPEHPPQRGGLGRPRKPSHPLNVAIKIPVICPIVPARRSITGKLLPAVASSHSRESCRRRHRVRSAEPDPRAASSANPHRRNEPPPSLPLRPRAAEVGVFLSHG